MPIKITDTIEVEYLIACDDVREEAGNKFSAMGIINGGIVLPSFPAVIRIAFFGHLLASQAGDTSIVFRVSLGDQTIGTASTPFAFTETVRSANLVLPAAMLQVPEATDIRLEVRGSEEQDWVLLLTKSITLNPAIVATASEQPS
jgi:uncharacterized protein DUF6941